MSGTASGPVVVVTGASSGIGRGAAHAFAARGDSVVLAARSASTRIECEQRGGRALAPRRHGLSWHPPRVRHP
jgi:NAD(P)-dependent dehydrogenase (short-subunit alcohol dehydrogenase family)